MRKISYFSVLALFAATLIISSNALSQAKPGDGTPSQRLDVMRQKLDTMRRSLNSSASVLREENKGDESKEGDKNKPETALGRLVSLEKDVSRLSSEVNSIRGKVDRSEKFEMSEIDQLEQAVGEMLTRVDAVQLETANARAADTSPVGKEREIKKKKKFLGIFGGGGNDEYDELIGSVSPGRDRELFIVATREIRKKRFDVGRLLFQTIITTYPDSAYLPMAKLAVADSFFLEGGTSSLIQAIAAYQDWLTFFPTHALADRVVLKIGEAEMRQIGLPDRDATRAKRAEVRLKALLQQYPNTILKKDAEERLSQVQNNLGLHNLYIANYYYTQSVNQGKSGLKGAQSRYLEILEKYPQFGYMDEALFKLAVTYMTEEETDQAARYFQRIIRDYPNSEYIAKSKEQLELMGASIPEPNPERASVMRPDDGGFFANFKNQFFGVYPMTIDKNGVLMTKDFDKCKFELIDQIIANQGDLYVNQIPSALSTIVPADKIVSTTKLACETDQQSASAQPAAAATQTQPK